MKHLCLFAVILTSASVVSAEPPSQLNEAKNYKLSYFDFFMFEADKELGQRFRDIWDGDHENLRTKVLIQLAFEEAGLKDKLTNPALNPNIDMGFSYSGFTYNPDDEEFSVSLRIMMDLPLALKTKYFAQIYNNDLTPNGESSRRDFLEGEVERAWRLTEQELEYAGLFKGYSMNTLDRKKFTDFVIRNTKVELVYIFVTEMTWSEFKDEDLSTYEQALHDKGIATRYCTATRRPGSGRVEFEVEDKMLKK